ncbi:MAG: 3D domain-containing protein [Phycisphaerales bacterium]|nr:3D domain-containing protein [Phycisphaerales bacterium]
MLPQFQISNAIARSRWVRVSANSAAILTTLSLVVGSAILAKEWRSAPPLVRVVDIPGSASAATANEPFPVAPPIDTQFTIDDISLDEHDTADPPAVSPIDEPRDESTSPELPGGAIEKATSIDPHTLDPRTRWFNGRPIKPTRQMWMIVTGYSPDSRSCGESADGITATLHSVDTNAHKLVAADPRVLPYGSMLSIPGYDSDLVVPVLDCGSAIKGNRLDLLFPTHEQARQWGKKKLLVTIWAYADGKPAENPRKLR